MTKSHHEETHSMIEERICLRLIDREKNLSSKTVVWPVEEIEYVEQLVDNILESEGVSLVYRSLFGLRFIREHVWLPPNASVKSVCLWANDGKSTTGVQEAKIELRFRFRPSCYDRLLVEDKIAFNLVFQQVRYDFMRTKFSDEKRAFVLLNNGVLALVALDLIRHAIESNIDIKDIVKRVDKEKFIPKRASRWQRFLIFRFASQINLQKSLQIGYERCAGDPYRAKREFLEIFFSCVAPNYGSECYNVSCESKSLIKELSISLSQSSSEVKLESRNNSNLVVRIRYMQKNGSSISRESNDKATIEDYNISGDFEESFCILEARRCDIAPRMIATSIGDDQDASVSSKPVWYQICDIETINHANLREDTVQITRLNGYPVRFRFNSRCHAKSFLSIIDGYYRLMKKWNFNLCREVFSPSLRYLKQNRCHGPIGYEATIAKLPHLKSSGTFLIRRCMKESQRYFVDTILPADTRLTVDIDYDKDGRFYTKVGFVSDKKTLKITVKTSQDRYPCLKSLINDIEIRVKYDKHCDDFTQQLKHWLQPDEDDYYPALLLSMSKRNTYQSGGKPQHGSLKDLPHVIPPDMLVVSDDKTKLGSAVRLAKFDGIRDVILKYYRPEPNYLKDSESVNKNLFTFHFCPKRDNSFRSQCSHEQLRFSDWIFIKSSLFAETLGYLLMEDSLVQEHFPLGPLNRYLAHNTCITDVTKISASFQLAQALLYLQEKKIIHGKIRCHNVFVSRTYPIHIKLSDPLGILDTEQDLAFIPPEFFKMSVGFCVREFYHGIDVWAFGTTLWQIYSRGVRPPPERYANTLSIPSECPARLWDIIEACWRDDPGDRPTPQVLYRDLNDLLAWGRGAHEYLYISQDVIDDRTINISRDSLINNLTTSENSSPYDSSSINTKDSFEPAGTNSSPVDSEESGRNSAPPPTPPRSYETHDLLKAQTKRTNTWISFHHLRDRAGTLFGKPSEPDINGDLAPSYKFSRLSLTSLSSSATHSEATGVTDLPDSDSISEAINRCVWHVDANRLKLGPEIGRGSSGVVRKGFLTEVNGMQEQVVAVKCIDRESLGFNSHQLNDLKREFNILKDLNHKNIVKTLGYVDEERMMLIFEYMPLGSLISSIQNLHQSDLKDLPLGKYAYDIAHGMEYLESKKIIHRDLALRNILLKSRNEVKICDFGLAQFLGSSNHYRLKTERALPLKWYAPEAICTSTFSHKSDVWSYGVVLWEIYSGGDHPQYSGELKDLTETLKQERLKRPKDCPQEMYDLMLACWAYEPDDRISFSKIKSLLMIN